MTLADASRYPVTKQGVEHMEVIGQFSRREVRLCRHHAAADVDSHRRGQERVLGGDDTADCCSQAEVCVRHEADGSGQDGQPRSPQCLLQGVVVELAGPRGQIRIYLLQHCSLPISLDTATTKQCARSGRPTNMHVQSAQSRWRVSNSRIPMYETGAQPPEHHWREPLRGKLVGAPGADPDADG